MHLEGAAMTIVALNVADVKGVPTADQVGSQPQTSAEAEREIRQRLDALITDIRKRSTADTVLTVERFLFAEVLLLGRLLLQFFLSLAHEALDVPGSSRRGRARFERQGPKGRALRTVFGPLRYVRFYMHKKNGKGGGYFPLDEKLGLTADGFSLQVLSWATQLGTKMSYAAAAMVLRGFIGWSPSTKSIEKAVLGLGGYAEEYLDGLPRPADDGEVLILQFDGKGIPTATAAELDKRRGERPERTSLKSARHRGREKRRRRGPKTRRARGDKSKNARVSHVIVLYTLRRHRDENGCEVLIGPVNKRVYVSPGTKKQAIQRGRRLADRRGFTADSGKDVQILTDGDVGYADAIGEYFPEVVAKGRHTLDMLHAVEYLWEAAYLLEPDDQATRANWVAERKSELCTDALDEMLDAMRSRLDELSDDEPPVKVDSRKGKGRPRKRKTPRQKLRGIIAYLETRTHMMNYQQLGREDLEWATGIVEGAVNYVLGQRFDEGGMRWIRERSAPLAHLRCVEINGCWDDFIGSVNNRLMTQARRSKSPPRLLTNVPPPLPAYDAAA